MACQRRLRLQNQVLMSLERHVQDRGTARERGGVSGMEGRGGRGTSGPSLWPPLPQDAQNSQARGKPNRSSRSCPPAQPLDPRKAVKPSQSLSRGVWRGLPKPCSPRGAGSTAAWRPQTHHLPRRDSLTGPGLPKLRPGLLLRRVPLAESLLSASRGLCGRGDGFGPTGQAPFGPATLPGLHRSVRSRRSGPSPAAS